MKNETNPSRRDASSDIETSSLCVPLNDASGLTVNGPHRFHTVAGRTGLQVTSLHTQAVVRTDLHREPRGTVSFWFSPLETLTFQVKTLLSSSGVTLDYPFLSDVFPGRNVSQARFGVAFAVGYPALIARFASGAVWERMDYGLAPFVYAEKAILRQGCWYQLSITWDRAARKLVLYLNGQMAGHNVQADDFEQADSQLFLGNPAMVMADLRLENRVLNEKKIHARYVGARLSPDARQEADLREALVPEYLAPLDMQRDSSWKTAFECPLTRPADLEHWVRQGPTKFMEDFQMETSAEGLLIRTSPQVHKETRMYLWSRGCFEGDQWIEFDFRIESPKGLALLVACASGMQREDFLADHGIPETGSMSTIMHDMRCYHWEFVRRVEAMRTDVETQYLSKNTVGWKLACRCVPRLEQHRWYRLRFIKAGNRLHGSFDGQTVFDLRDNPLTNNGPVYDFGRIALRQMYNTTLRYRNLVVWQRDNDGNSRTP
ncbi:DUF1961 family protein [Opitutaceae bacterium TAV4]|nr:DUF1961 family protein [Opitutaceae bacterium TAV4]RRJ99914.1 DUF1961 family protein [Opitutaceae bacterium TAV3]